VGNNNSKFLQFSILIGLVLVWGSSFILMKKGLVVFSAPELAALRISISFIFLLPFALTRFKKIKKENWKYLAFAGIIGNGIPSFLFAIAQTGIDSSLAGILNSLTPLFAMIVGYLFFKSKSKWFNVVGVIIGLIGAVGLIAASGNKTFLNNIEYGALIIVATIFYAFNLNVVKTNLKNVDAVTITSFAFFSIGLPALIYLLTSTDAIFKIQTNEKALTALLYVSILAVFGSALAVIAYNYLIKISSVLFAASVTYMMPLISYLWGVFDGEKFELIFFLWIFLILAGVYLVNKKNETNDNGILNIK
jgi:drug/metabolite transporter (DMT)-like permease